MTDANGNETLTPWWGKTHVDYEETLFWQIGPLRLWVQRLRGEWRIAHRSLDDPLDATMEVARPSAAAEIDEGARFRRFALGDEGTTMEIAPMLADRPMVSRPDKPFEVLPGEEIVLFVGSPLWAAVSTVGPARLLCDLPAFRPSDTWFGPPDGSGELCYASTTVCRLHIEDVPFRPHRCVTAVTVRNKAETPLALDRLRLPVNGLALYVADNGRLWSQDVTLERQEDAELAHLSIDKASPAHAKNPKPLAGPRVAQQTNVIVRAFSSLFS